MIRKTVFQNVSEEFRPYYELQRAVLVVEIDNYLRLKEKYSKILKCNIDNRRYFRKELRKYMRDHILFFTHKDENDVFSFRSICRNLNIINYADQIWKELQRIDIKEWQKRCRLYGIFVNGHKVMAIKDKREKRYFSKKIKKNMSDARKNKHCSEETGKMVSNL